MYDFVITTFIYFNKLINFFNPCRPDRLKETSDTTTTAEADKRSFAEQFGKQYGGGGGGWDFFKKAESAKQLFEAEAQARETKERNFNSAQGLSVLFSVSLIIIYMISKGQNKIIIRIIPHHVFFLLF